MKKKALSQPSIKKYLSLKYLWVYILLVILGVAIFFRFFNIQDRYVFDFDPTRDALISLEGENKFLFPLSGPKSGIADFTFGPWYYYQIIIFSILTPFKYAPWIYIGITSAASVLVYFFIGKLLVDRRLGLILAFIVAIAASEIGPVTGLSNPNLVPIQSSLAVLFFVIYIKKKLSFWWLFAWGFVIGVGINHHYQAIGLLFLPIIAILYTRKDIIKTVSALLLGLLISFIPLIVFNITENWHTIRGLQDYLVEGRSSAPNRWQTYILEFWPNLFSYIVGVPMIVGLIIAVYILLVTILAWVKKTVPRGYLLLLGVLLINFLFVRYATSVRENYYFLYLHPFIFTAWAFSIWYALGNKYLKWGMFFLAYAAFFFNVKEDIRRLPDERESKIVRNNIAIIEETYPSGVTVYRCGDRVANTAQIMAFFLYHDKKLAENGTTIGLRSDQCDDNTPFTYMPFDNNSGYVLLDFKMFPEAKKYWTPVTPASVYNDNLIQ